MSVLSPAQQRELRARAHHLKPIVTVAGKGLSEAVLAEIDRSLQAHELLKVKLQGVEREQQPALLAELCTRLDAAAVQHIGNILVIWRQRRAEDTDRTAADQPRAAPKPAPRASTAKSAAAFAAAARRAALAQASSGPRNPGRSAGRTPPGRSAIGRPAARGR
ncbi:MAG: YhbY family RNA-binding protein [Thauera sp.]|jgi:putative YhbY family RNA-binding protein|nr:YhbY family RNA-binding protein [Thauera sp.]